MQADLLNQMKACRLTESDVHTRLIMALQMSDAVGKHLWYIIQQGNVATESLNVRGSRID